jgi:hypothetical protein
MTLEGKDMNKDGKKKREMHVILNVCSLDGIYLSSHYNISFPRSECMKGLPHEVTV